MTGDGRGFRILVLCAGNIGRSPLAEVMLRASLADALGLDEAGLAAYGVAVRSAGTAAPVGHAASSRGVAFAAERDLDLTQHRASQVLAEDLDDADLVLCMDNQQMTVVATMAPRSRSKAQLLAGEGVEIPDPRHQNDEFFRDVAERIEFAVRQRIPVLLAQIERRLGPGSGGVS